MSSPRPPFDALLLCVTDVVSPARPLAGFHPVGRGSFIGQLPAEMEERILTAWSVSTPYVPGCHDKPVYAFITERRSSGPDAEENSIGLMYLASLLKPTLVSARYGARISALGTVEAWGRYGAHFEHSYMTDERPQWIQEADLPEFRKVAAADAEARGPQLLKGTRLGRALSAFWQLLHTYNVNQRVVSAVSVLEGLIAGKEDDSGRTFEHRVHGLSNMIGGPVVSRRDAAEAYNLRSRLAHTGGLDILAKDDTSWTVARRSEKRISELLRTIENLLRVCLRRGLIDTDFRALFEDRALLSSALPVPPAVVPRCRSCQAKEPRASVLRCEVCKKRWPDEVKHAETERRYRELKKQNWQRRSEGK